MGIPPDPVPPASHVASYSGTTTFDKSTSVLRRSAELRFGRQENVVGLSLLVVPPSEGMSSLAAITHVGFGHVHKDQVQIVVTLDSVSGEPVPDGFKCQFSLLMATRSK
jgi:hypothetical protein